MNTSSVGKPAMSTPSASGKQEYRPYQHLLPCVCRFSHFRGCGCPHWRSTNTDAHTYALADAFLLPPHPHFDVSPCGPYNLGIRGSLHCIAFTPTNVGIAAHLGSPLHRSGSLSGPGCPFGPSTPKNYLLVSKQTFFLFSLLTQLYKSVYGVFKFYVR